MSNTTHHQPAAQPELAPHAMQQLTAALQADPDYAWSWHCNLAMPIMDATNVSPALANVAGARLMRHLFDIDMTKHPHYLPRFDEEVAAQPEPVNALLLAALHLAVDALRAPLDGWKGELERKALDAANPVIVAATAQAQPAAVPLFLLHTGKIDNSGEQDEWDCEADSGKRVQEFCRQHPGQTIWLYAQPVPALPAPAVPASQILGAVARGWCHPENSAKAMDSDLALAIAAEIAALLAALLPQMMATLQDADTLMGHGDAETAWRERWALLWPNVRANAAPRPCDA